MCGLLVGWMFYIFEPEGEYVAYHENGLLDAKGNYKKGKQEGYWRYYYKYGSVNKNSTGIYENGKRD